MCLSSVLRILPLTVLRRLATNSTFLGYLYGAVVAFTCSWAGVDTRHGFIQHNLKVIFAPSDLQLEDEPLLGL